MYRAHCLCAWIGRLPIESSTMPRAENPDILKAFVMHYNGMDFHKAWQQAGEPCTWDHARRQ